MTERSRSCSQRVQTRTPGGVGRRKADAEARTIRRWQPARLSRSTSIATEWLIIPEIADVTTGCRTFQVFVRRSLCAFVQSMVYMHVCDMLTCSAEKALKGGSGWKHWLLSIGLYSLERLSLVSFVAPIVLDTTRVRNMDRQRPTQPCGCLGDLKAGREREQPRS